MNSEQMRELDEWLAEYVFGWHRQRFDNGSTRFNTLVPEKFRADKYRKHGWLDGNPHIQRFPRYTTDPAAALEVLKKCAETFRDVICIYQCLQSDSWDISATVFGGEDEEDSREINVSAPTLELAIALFAKQIYSRKDA